MTRLPLLFGLLATAFLFAAPDAAAQQCDITTTGQVNLSDIRPAPGQTITVSHSFVSDGSGPCPEVLVGHFFSTDSFFSDDDELLGTVTLPASQPQTNLSVSAEVTIPAGTPRGGYVVLAVADYLGEIDEVSESDNVMVGGDLTIGGDLSGPNLDAVPGELEDDTAAPGDRVSFDYAIRNEGAADVEDFEVGFYLRPINAPPSEWIFLESETIGNIDAGDTEEEQEQVTIPLGTPAATYALLFVADDGNAIEEWDETDNVSGTGLIEITGAVSSEGTAAGAVLSLAASPNPSGGTLALSYELATPSAVRLAVYDTLGREVARLADGARGAGAHRVAVDASGWALGVYVVRLSANGETATRTVTVVR